MKFTVITPESLEMSRLIMSVVGVAMGGEQQEAGDSGSNSNGGIDVASIVSNISIENKLNVTSCQLRPCL